MWVIVGVKFYLLRLQKMRREIAKKGPYVHVPTRAPSLAGNAGLLIEEVDEYRIASKGVPFRHI